LFPHATGRWAKKIRGKLFYFGPWGTRRNGKLVRLPDDGWTEAEALYEQQRADLYAGREPQNVGDDGCTLRELCNAFLTSKRNKLESGELSGDTFADYHRTCSRLIDYFGKSQQVNALRPADFEGFRKQLAKGLSVITLKNEINRCRIVLKYAHDQGMIDRPVSFGQSFDKPSARMLRKARHEAGPKLFTAGELRLILDALKGKPVIIKGETTAKKFAPDPMMRAMVLLGINCGLGNTDIANLPKSAIDLHAAWLTYPRPKTGIPRRIPLWPETITALNQSIRLRPAPTDASDNELCFITIQGNRWVRVLPSKSNPDQFVSVNTISARFSGLLKALGVNPRKRQSFYTLRHCFETVAGGSRDQVAVDAIMGHVDNSMAAAYREGIDDHRLRAVTDHVHRWLYGDAVAAQADG
jgi:integrase